VTRADSERSAAKFALASCEVQQLHETLPKEHADQVQTLAENCSLLAFAMLSSVGPSIAPVTSIGEGSGGPNGRGLRNIVACMLGNRAMHIAQLAEGNSNS